MPTPEDKSVVGIPNMSVAVENNGSVSNFCETLSRISSLFSQEQHHRRTSAQECFVLHVLHCRFSDADDVTLTQADPISGGAVRHTNTSRASPTTRPSPDHHHYHQQQSVVASSNQHPDHGSVVQQRHDEAQEHRLYF
jgi:hypothetical protein